MRYRIDVDAGDEDRPDIYNYIIDKFGADKTARVLALGTTSEKSTIENICRAFEVPLDKVDKIKKEWDANPDKCKKDYPEIFYYFDGILGSYTSQSIHPAGIVASPITLYDNYGVFWDSDGLQMSYLDMDCVHDAGLVKYDILTIRQISIIKATCKYIGIPYPKSYQINWNDPKVWEDMKKSQIAIFQFEEDYSFKSLCDYGTNSIDDMTVVTAAIRPSGASYREDLFAHKPHKNPSELIDNLLSDTSGYLVYQEQILSFLQQICGLSGSEADDVRRGIARKKVDVLQSHMQQILDGYCEKSDKPREVAEQEAQEFLQIIEDASSYMFGKLLPVSLLIRSTKSKD